MENDEETKEREALKNQNREKHLHDDNDEIMLIPDLDEEGGADSDQRIAHAPRNVNRKIPTLAELESDIKKTAARFVNHELNETFFYLISSYSIQRKQPRWGWI